MPEYKLKEKKEEDILSMKKSRKIKKWIPFYIMAAPCIIYLFINNYMPIAGIQIAFRNYKPVKGIWGSTFVGFKNFEYLFKSSEAWIFTRNTLGYNLLWIVLNVLLGVTVAICLNEVKSKLSKKIYQTFILLPYLMSMVVASYLAYAFLSEPTGMINSVIEALGGEPIAWYREAKYWPVILTIVNAWKTVGFNSIVYLSTISGFDRAYYDAAEVDGASKWQQITKITVPMLLPTIIMLVTIAMGHIFNSDFGMFYQIPKNQGLLYSTTTTVDTFVFRSLLETGDIGMSSAASFLQSIISFITIMIFNGIVRKISRENAMF